MARWQSNLGVLRRFALALAATSVCAVAACGPRATSDSAAPSPGAPRAPKVLTRAVRNEPAFMVPGVGQFASVRPDPVWHRTLAIQNQTADWQADLATDLPSVANQTWRINPDGSMDTVWKIRPNLTWHDGAPFTTADLRFAWEVYKAPEATPPDGSARQLMESATVLDPVTISVHWAGVYVDANLGPNLVPLPKHLLEERFRSGWDTFVNSPELSNKFVGLGPFRLVNWQPGAFMELEAFDGFYLGRPHIDRLIYQFIGDPNTMLANLLAGAIETMGAELDQVSSLAEMGRIGPSGSIKVVYTTSGSLQHLELQHRTEYARPLNGLPKLLVRQALSHATDRQQYTDVLYQGLAPPMDSWIRPSDTIRPQVEASIPKYPFDLRRAQQLMEQAGWTRGADGVLVHQPSGERFNLLLFKSQSSNAEQLLNLIGSNWKAVGVDPELMVLPAARLNDLEWRSQQSGAGYNGIFLAGYYGARLYMHSRSISSPANRWAGSNRSGYSNPQVDAILDRLVSTIDPAERLALHRELLQTAISDVPMIPLAVGVSAILHSVQVTGLAERYVEADSDFNIHQWDKN